MEQSTAADDPEAAAATKLRASPRRNAESSTRGGLAVFEHIGVTIARTGSP